MKKFVNFILFISLLFTTTGCSKLSEYKDKFYKRQSGTSVYETQPQQDNQYPQQSNQNQSVVQNSPTPSLSNYTRFSLGEINQLIDLHNQVRSNVGVSPVSWSNEVASTAQSWANQLGQWGCNMRHSQSRYGENLFMGWGGNYGVADAVRSWESEKQYYHGQTIDNSNFSVFGHYTQMVWRNTQEIGCGKATCGQKVVMVCNYNPAGNFIGQKPY